MEKIEYGCIGEHLGHSFSKEIHNLIGDYDYKIVEICEPQLEELLCKKQFSGINVTIPYKQKVMQYLDSIDPVAEKIGAVNTIVNKNGKLFGYNTDYYGMTEAIKRSGIELCGKRVLILGTGGTSKTAQKVAIDLKAEEIAVTSRTKKKNCITYSQAVSEYSDADVIINTTPCGMYPDIFDAPIDIDDFNKLSGVFDAVYNPINTTFIQRAKQKGIKTGDGLFMLVAQAVFASKFFFPKTTADIESIYGKLKRSKQNIVLTGMPSSGKTTVGKLLAKKIGFDFIDTDEEITKITGLTPDGIFSEKGEEYFRGIEKKVIYDVAKRTHSVIATGGGAVLDSDNVTALKYNGRIFYLMRPANELLPTADRPTARTKKAIEKLYRERKSIYEKSADFTVEANESAEKTAEKIIKIAGIEL